MGSWVYWQSSGPSKFRALLGGGVVMVNWNAPPTTWGIGTVSRNLGTDLTINGRRATWYVQRPWWSVEQFAIDLLPVVRGGHVEIPVFYLAVFAAIPPAFVAWRRSRAPGPGHCKECGYDLRGAASAACPECGQVRHPNAAS